MSDKDVICGNPDCRVADDNKCVEGYDLDKCPFYGRSLEENSEAAEQEKVEKEEEEKENKLVGTPLDLALALEVGGATRALRQSASRVIAIVGAQDSGKTSLIAGLYDLFQVGPVAGVSFAGSSTLHALEEVCHDARAASLRDVAHSERTKRGEVKFFHVDLRIPGRPDQIALLIGDRTGEDYEEVADTVANVAPMVELKRAGTVTILVDGKRLCDAAARHDAINALQLIVQGLREGGAFDHRPRLALVLTKHDDVLSSPNVARAMEDVNRILEALRRRHGAAFSKIELFVTAASPKNVEVTPRGTGLPELLAFWLEPTAIPDIPVQPIASERVFARLEPREE
jgi:hypothetical protein